MNVYHIQIPKTGDDSVQHAIERIKEEYSEIYKLLIIEYEHLYIVDGVTNPDVKTKLTETLQQLQILHF